MSNEENIKSDNKSGDSSDLPTIPALGNFHKQLTKFYILFSIKQ